MLTEVQEYSVLLIAGCVFLLAAVNVFLIWRLLKGGQSEALQLDAIAELCRTMIAEQLSVREVVMQASEAAAENPALAQLEEVLPQLDSQAGELNELILEMQQVSPEEFAAWKLANEQKIADLLARGAAMKEQIAALQMLLASANSAMTDLRARNRKTAATAAAPAADDKKLSAELDQVRRNSARLNTELNTAQQNIQVLNTTVAARDKKLADLEATRAADLKRLEAEKFSLQEKIKEMQAAFDRTLVEKHFIEDAFLAETGDKR